MGSDRNLTSDMLRKALHEALRRPSLTEGPERRPFPPHRLSAAYSHTEIGCVFCTFRILVATNTATCRHCSWSRVAVTEDIML